MAEYRKSDTIETLRPDDRQTKAQRARSIAIAVGLLALAVLFYASTVVKLGPNALSSSGLNFETDRSVPDPDFVAPLPAKE